MHIRILAALVHSLKLGVEIELFMNEIGLVALYQLQVVQNACKLYIFIFI